MHFYSIPLNAVLNMPIYTFWEMSQNVQRIMAEEDMRMVAIVTSALGGAKELVQNLNKERGEVVKVENPYQASLDRDGLAQLKRFMGG